MGRRVAPRVDAQRLIRLARPDLRRAERLAPRTGRGDKPDIPDWLIAGMIMVAVLHRKKSKSAQYRFLGERRAALAAGFGDARFPSRATYFRRYRRAHRLFRVAIRLQGERAVREAVADPTQVAVDKSLVPGHGPPWHRQDRRAGTAPAGVDVETTWGYSEHDGWVQGYSYEVVVTATPRGVVFPVLASADTASASETKTFAAKVGDLPAGTEAVSADSGYDANHLGEAVEYDPDTGRRTGRRFLCPENPRNGRRPKTRPGGADAARAKSRARRAARRRFLASRRGRRIYGRRKTTVEPFNHWLKRLFELEARVWHRGLDNNRTQLLAAIFSYQLLVRLNHRCGHDNGCICWILDAL
jgi:Transposase DDE domain